MMRCFALFAAGLAIAASASAQQPAISHEAAADIARHIGSAPTDPGPRAHLSPSMRPSAIRAAMLRVGNWELAQAMPQPGQNWFGQDWTWGVLYTGYMAAGASLPAPEYTAAMRRMGARFHWQLLSPVPSADDQAIAQTYTELYLRDHDPVEIAATEAAMARLMQGENTRIPANQAQIPWWWCDALFMAPPVWARMYAATHDPRYLAYLDAHFWQTSSTLYSPRWHLYFRDTTYRNATAPNGMPVFWSRGEGWVMAGIVRTLAFLPRSDPHRAEYITQLQEMAGAVAPLQDRATGLWHANLLDAKDSPLPETSGSALMTYALAWGVAQHMLNRAVYLPVVRRAWAGLVEQIYADGRLGSIQQVGSAPGGYLPSSSYNYGVGAFLLAGSQVLQLSQASR